MRRSNKISQDRLAGLVFDWRPGHGSGRRLLYAVLISGSVWSLMVAFVQIKETTPTPVSRNKLNLVLVDYDAPENRQLAASIDRETIFHRRWEISPSNVLEREIEQALSIDSPLRYQPTLREIPPPEIHISLDSLPGRGPANLPPPTPVEEIFYAIPPANWWIEISTLSGPENLEALEFKWPPSALEGAAPEIQMSEGEEWTVMIAADSSGMILAAESWQDADDPRTPAILAKCREIKIPSASEDASVRWWKLVARVVNRPILE